MKISLTEDQSTDPEILADLERLSHPYYSFRPRPDQPELYDEQTGYVDSRNLISFLIGGNGSGKTLCSAVKCARFVLEQQPPPLRKTPFWIISEKYETVCRNCWVQKLSEIIPMECVDWEGIRWYDRSLEYPYVVPLKPWPGRPGKNWQLEFKSYEGGRQQLQGASIGGAWLSEQFTWDIFVETLRGCRDYMYPGGMFAEFTPIDPELVVEVKTRFDNPPAGWGFFRTNTEENVKAGGIKSEWLDIFLSGFSDEMRAVRTIGAFAGYEGAIYQSFNPRIHVVEDMQIPQGAWHRRGIDWGASTEHPFVCLWGCKNALGQWFIYNEYWNNSQNMTALDHIEKIKEASPWPESHPLFGMTYADPSRPDLLNLFTQFGITTQPASNDVYKGIETIRRHLKVSPGMCEPMLFIDKDCCPKLVEQMGTYRWRKSTAKGINPQVAKPEPLKRSDDAVDAIRYLIHSDCNVGGKPPERLHAPWRHREGIRFRPHARH